MLWHQTEAPGIENQFNQPLSLSFIYPPPSLLPFHGCALGCGGRTREGRQDLEWSWEELIIRRCCLESIEGSFVKNLQYYGNAL